MCIYLHIGRDGKNPKNPKYVAVVFGFLGFTVVCDVLLRFCGFIVFHKKLKCIK